MGVTPCRFDSGSRHQHFPTEARIAQLVERNLAKVEVAGSNPVSRSSYLFSELVVVSFGDGVIL